MKIAVFYENIYDGVQASGLRMDETLKQLKDAGMEMLYISAESWKRDRQDLSGILEKLELSIEGMHAFCDFPGTPDSDRYRELIDLAAESGSGNLLFVPGMLSTGNSIRDLNNILSGLKKAVEYGESRNLPILLEDYDGLLAPYNSIAGVQFFMKSVEGLKCAFDTGNFVMFHEDELEAFDLFADKIVTVHLKDRSLEKRHPEDVPCICADGKAVYSCRIGSGMIRMDEILRRLRDREYKGNVIVELFCCDRRFVLQEILESVRWLKTRTKA